MPALTRKRVNDRPMTWHVHYAGVRVGMIVERSGAPQILMKAALTSAADSRPTLCRDR
jgi:hypothetical protein